MLLSPFGRMGLLCHAALPCHGSCLAIPLRSIYGTGLKAWRGPSLQQPMPQACSASVFLCTGRIRRNWGIYQEVAILQAAKGLSMTCDPCACAALALPTCTVLM